MTKDVISTHPLSEAVGAENDRQLAALAVDTFDGKVHEEWDQTAAVTPIGQLPFFSNYSPPPSKKA